MYANHIKNAASYSPIASTDTAIHIKPAVTFANTSYNGKVTLTVKTTDRLLGKKSFTVNGGIISNDSISILKSDIGNDKIWFELFSDDCLIADAISNAAVQVKSSSMLLAQSVDANLYAVNEPAGFGHLYRGWGGFVYNAAENRYSRPIDESLLKLPEDENAQIDPLTMAFVPMSPDLNRLDRLQGQREEVFITTEKWELPVLPNLM